MKQMLYIDHPPLATLYTEIKAYNYNKALSWVYEPFRILEVAEHTLNVDEKGK